jgi:hypothetical protein
VDANQWSPAAGPPFFTLLSARVPPVLPNNGSNIDDNYVLRYQPVKINDVPGTIDIQNILESFDWIRMNGDALAYAPHPRSSILPGVPRILAAIGRVRASPGVVFG